MQSITECLPSGEYKFTITDLAGDGICCDHKQGRYEILVNGIMNHTGGEFGSLETKTFGACPKSQILARKVRVQLEGQNYLHMREVQVWDQSGINVALNKTASQSSTEFYLGSAIRPASDAVNGVVNMTDMSSTGFDLGKYRTTYQLHYIHAHHHHLQRSNVLVFVKAPGGKWIWNMMYLLRE